jgi:hypothetical protein
MRYLLVGVLLAVLALGQFAHERWSMAAPDAACMAPQAQRDVLRDLLLQHFQGH